MFKRILVAVDGSPNAWEALAHAVALAKGVGAERIGVVHVRPSLTTLSHAYGFDELAMHHLNLARRMERELKEGETQSRALLREAVARIRDAGIEESKVACHAEEGPVVRKILDVVQREGYDLLVMGSRGMGRAAGLLLGSVTQSLVANMPCTVLVVECREHLRGEC
ncbi:MAG TPA: universal stress protein [Limnochordales bacterium]|nr:universal stress protein [Limnochordales bacterium]